MSQNEENKLEMKLQMIRNVLIQEIKETDLIKKNMEELKEYINNIINLNINFFNQRILNGTGNLSLVTQKKVIKDSVENLQNNLEDDNTEYIAIETNIAIKNNKVENVENKEKEEKVNISFAANPRLATAYDKIVVKMHLQKEHQNDSVFLVCGTDPKVEID